MSDDHDPDDDLLGYDQLLDEDYTPDEARTVLGPHSAISRREAHERLEMFRLERGWEDQQEQEWEARQERKWLARQEQGEDRA
jgi:hypothetical protein